jgi:hypothetical protein
MQCGSKTDKNGYKQVETHCNTWKQLDIVRNGSKHVVGLENAWYFSKTVVVWCKRVVEPRNA